MEQEDKLLKDFLQSEEDMKAPDGFTDRVMSKLDQTAIKNSKPLIPLPVRIGVLLLCLAIPFVAIFGGDLPKDNWIHQIELQDSLNQSIQFLQEFALIGTLVVVILAFILIDRILRSRRKMSI